MRKIVHLSIVASSLLLLTACGGSSDDSMKPGGTTSQPEPRKVIISGKVVDGPIRGAKVCLDVNENLKCDKGEPTDEQTDSDGSYNISVDEGTIKGNIISEGGIDTDDDSPVMGILRTKIEFHENMSEVNITPATTLMNALVDEGETETQAKEVVKDLLKLNNVSDVTSIEEKAQDSFAALHKLATEDGNSYKKIAKDITDPKSGQTQDEAIKIIKEKIEKKLDEKEDNSNSNNSGSQGSGDDDAGSGGGGTIDTSNFKGMVYPSSNGKVYYDKDRDGTLDAGEKDTKLIKGKFDSKKFADVEASDVGHPLFVFRENGSELSATFMSKDAFKDHIYINPVTTLITELGNLIGDKIKDGKEPKVGNITMGDLVDYTKIAKNLGTYRTEVSKDDLLENPLENKNLKRVCDRIDLVLKLSGKTYKDLAKRFEDDDMKSQYADLDTLLKPFVKADTFILAENKNYSITTDDFDKFASVQYAQNPKLKISYDPTYPERAGVLKEQDIYVIKLAGSDFVSEYTGRAFKDKVSFKLEESATNYELTSQVMGAGKTFYYIESKTMETKPEKLTINILVDGVKKDSFTLDVKQSQAEEPEYVDINKDGNEAGVVLNKTFTYDIANYKLNILYKGEGLAGSSNSYIFKTIGDNIDQSSIKVKVVEGDDKYTITDNGSNSIEIAQQSGVQDEGKVKIELTGKLKNGKDFKGTFEVTLVESPTSIVFKKMSFDFFAEDLSAPITIAYDKAKAGKVEGNTIYPFEFLGKDLVDSNNAFKDALTFTVDPSDKYEIDGNKVQSKSATYEKADLKIYLNINGDQGTHPRYFSIKIKEKSTGGGAINDDDFKLKATYDSSTYQYVTKIYPSSSEQILEFPVSEIAEVKNEGIFKYKNVEAVGDFFATKEVGQKIQIIIPANTPKGTYKAKVKADFEYGEFGQTPEKIIPSECIVTFKVLDPSTITGPSVKAETMNFDLAKKSTAEVTLKDGSKAIPVFRLKDSGILDDDELDIVGDDGDAKYKIRYKLVDTTKYEIKTYIRNGSDYYAVFLSDPSATADKDDEIKIQLSGTLSSTDDVRYDGETTTITLTDTSSSTGGGDGAGTTVTFRLKTDVDYGVVNSADGIFEVELSSIIEKPADLTGATIVFGKVSNGLNKDKFDILASSPKLKIALKGDFNTTEVSNKILNINATYTKDGKSVDSSTELKLKFNRVLPQTLPDFTLNVDVNRTVDDGIEKGTGSSVAHFVLTNQIDATGSDISVFKDASGAGDYATENDKFEQLTFNIKTPADTKYEIVKKAGEGFYLQLKDVNAQKVVPENLVIEVSNGTDTHELHVNITPVVVDEVDFDVKSEIPVSLGTDTVTDAIFINLVREESLTINQINQQAKKGFFFPFTNTISQDDFAKLEFTVPAEYKITKQADFVALEKADGSALTAGDVAVKVKTANTDQEGKTITVKFEAPFSLGDSKLLEVTNVTGTIKENEGTGTYDDHYIVGKMLGDEPILFPLHYETSYGRNDRLIAITYKAVPNLTDVIMSGENDTYKVIKFADYYAVVLKKDQDPTTNNELTVTAKVKYMDENDVEQEVTKTFTVTINTTTESDTYAKVVALSSGEGSLSEDTNTDVTVLTKTSIKDYTSSKDDIYAITEKFEIAESDLLEEVGNVAGSIKYELVKVTKDTEDVTEEYFSLDTRYQKVDVKLDQSKDIPSGDYVLEYQAKKGETVVSDKKTISFTVQESNTPTVITEDITPNLLKRNLEDKNGNKPLFIFTTKETPSDSEIKVVSAVNGIKESKLVYALNDGTTSNNYEVKSFEDGGKTYYGIFTKGDTDTQTISKIVTEDLSIKVTVEGEDDKNPTDVASVKIVEPTVSEFNLAETNDPAVPKAKISGSYNYAELYVSQGTSEPAPSYGDPSIYLLTENVDYSNLIELELVNYADNFKIVKEYGKYRLKENTGKTVDANVQIKVSAKISASNNFEKTYTLKVGNP